MRPEPGAPRFRLGAWVCPPETHWAPVRVKPLTTFAPEMTAPDEPIRETPVFGLMVVVTRYVPGAKQNVAPVGAAFTLAATSSPGESCVPEQAAACAACGAWTAKAREAVDA